MTDRVREILSWYDAETPGSVANLYRLLSTGRLAGTGKLVILPVDQGFEHGPGTVSFAPNPAGYDPRYHAQLAVDAGCNGYAAPLGQLQIVAPRVRRSTAADPQAEQLRLAVRRPRPGASRDRQRRGCAAPRLRGRRLHDLPGLRRPQRRCTSRSGRAQRRGQGRRTGRGRVVLPARLGHLQGGPRRPSTCVAYAAQIAAQLGAHVIKVKPPGEFIESAAAREALEKSGTPIATIADRVKHVVAGRLRRPSHRHLQRWCGEGHRGGDRGEQADGARRRLRHDHGAQLLPAPARRCRGAAAQGDGHPRHDLARVNPGRP